MKSKYMTFNPWRLLALVAVPMLVVAGGLFAVWNYAYAGHFPGPTKLWGYQAAFANAQMAEYDIGADIFVTSCVPPGSVNGRGVAHDPFDGNLWFTVVFGGFAGDGLIHKMTPTPGCAALPSIPFGDGPGGSVQDAIGAIDIDPDDGHIWAAGYQPIGGQSFLYKVDRVTGAILQSCSVPFGGGGVGNDTLAVAKLAGLAGSGKYLLTDAGEPTTPNNGNTLLVVDAATCTSGGAGSVVASPSKAVNMTGIDFEGGKLIATDLGTIYDLGAFPFNVIGATMSANPVFNLEDITLETAPVLIEVDIDIKPGSDPNSINTKSKGLVPVAILGSATFDVNDVDATASILFGQCGNEGASPKHDLTDAVVRSDHTQDVASPGQGGPDGLDDLVIHFPQQDTNITTADTVACLEALTTGGVPIQGSDSVNVVK